MDVTVWTEYPIAKTLENQRLANAVCCPWCDAPPVVFAVVDSGVRITCGQTNGITCAVRPYYDGANFATAVDHWNMVCDSIKRVLNTKNYVAVVECFATQPRLILPPLTPLQPD